MYYVSHTNDLPKKVFDWDRAMQLNMNRTQRTFMFRLLSCFLALYTDAAEN